MRQSLESALSTTHLLCTGSGGPRISEGEGGDISPEEECQFPGVKIKMVLN